MTSPDPHGRETVQTVQTVEIGETPLAYSGGLIDRAANQRSDPGFLDATLAKASTRLIPMWRDHCVVSGEPPVPVILPAAEAGAVLDAAAEVVFLGLDDQGGIFAADLSAAGEAAAGEAAAGGAAAGGAAAGGARAAEVAGGERGLDVRRLAGA